MTRQKQLLIRTLFLAPKSNTVTKDSKTTAGLFVDPMFPARQRHRYGRQGKSHASNHIVDR
jgi:hypothetical protein